MTDCPCQNCKNRKVGCHGTCNDYKEWSAKEKKKNLKIKLAQKSYGTGCSWWQYKRY